MSQVTYASMDDGLQRMIRAHLWFGAMGLILGLISAAIVIMAGPEFLRASPMFTTLALGMIGAIALSMAGGLLTFFRPAPARN